MVIFHVEYDSYNYLPIILPYFVLLFILHLYHYKPNSTMQ